MKRLFFLIATFGTAAEPSLPPTVREGWKTEFVSQAPEIRTPSVVCAAPTTVPTFHCMSLYWPCENGAFTNRCDVAYRKADTETWRQAQELWWDAKNRFYAGSVVSLEAGAAYEFKLSLASGEQTVLRDKTWPDRFPIARTVTLPQGTQHQTLRITEGGTAGGFVLYEAHPAGTTIDADVTGGDEADALDHGIVVEADYVIIRGLTLRNAKQHGIFIRNRHDVVIEGCDISNWGRKDPRAGQRGTVQRYANGGGVEVTFSPTLAMHMDCAIRGEGAATHDIERVVVQGNRIHHPRYSANPWSEGSAFFNSFHPQGAKAVCLFRPGEEMPTKGNHVIRYNEFFSDPEHMFYDMLFDSQGSGPLQGTDAQRDIDIYGNIFRDCWDDCIELERGFGNFRVFENYFDRIFKASTGFISQSGPTYIFRNVFDRVLQPSRDAAPDTRAWTGGAYQVNGNRLFFYHNTMLCPGGDEGEGFSWAYGNDYKQINQGRGTVDDGNFTISRNNIYQTIRWPDEANYVTRRIHGGFSFDHDLYNGAFDPTLPEAAAMWGPHAIQGLPTYRSGHGSGHPGRTQLTEKSLGKDQGCVLPNFNDHHEGTAPDIGAHEFGTPDVKLGVLAYHALYADRENEPVEFQVVSQPDKLIITRHGRAVGEYVFRDAKIPRPYFSRLHAPDGTQLTRHHPPVEGVDATDHDTLHPGLWMAFGDLNGVDFWRNQGRIEHVRFVHEPRAGDGRVTFAVEEKYVAADGTEICRGLNEFCFLAESKGQSASPGTLLLWSTELGCATGPLTFGPQHEMGIGFRMATPFTAKGGSGRISSSHGGSNEAGNWGREAAWWDYSGTLARQRAGILAVPFAGNTRPVWAHARDYGFLALNPTGPPPDAKDVPAIPFTVPAGNAWKAKFGLLLYAQPSERPLDLQAVASAVNAVLVKWLPKITQSR